MVKIIAIGKKNEYQNKINDYSKRLSKQFEVSWILLNYSSLSNEQARTAESKEILSKLKPSDYVILLDERGKQIDNLSLSNMIVNNRNVVFIIGGPYGVTQELRDRANFVMSISKLIFPYEICRLLLVEQIYRSQMIFLNHPYHHI